MALSVAAAAAAVVGEEAFETFVVAAAAVVVAFAIAAVSFWTKLFVALPKRRRDAT